MPDKGKYNDAELLSLLKSGNHGVFTYIYKQYWTIMYSHALRMLKNEDDAQDVVQELFLTLYSKASTLKDGSNIESYLFITLRNKILNLIQQQKVRADYLEVLMQYPEPSANTVIASIQEKEIREAIEAEIARMPSKMREAYELSRKENLTHKEIAVQLHISEPTVKSHISHALKTIRQRLRHFMTLFSMVISLLVSLF
ncbi:RNA polymerase sigma-70 factor, ECF subfamily [bacterium A37T11]|nr:RNA polymerase sigma-70 factor, ECF subfamily [bacterium A37T11]